ncbi:MAG: homoserine dehydrogenase [Acetivibrionales bacterium]
MDIAIAGYGVVGSGVAEVIRKNSRSIASRAGEHIRVKKILDIRDFPEGPDSLLFTRNPDDIFNDPDIRVVVETIGGDGVAYEYTKRAFTAKKHVVTSNKELVAKHGPELLKMAADNGVNYLFEASVGGGIPIIKPLNECLAANIINGITGILNGTTNYMLTQMRREGRSFQEALDAARQNGYAEVDPTDDIEGIDACRKIAILSSIAYNEYVDCRKIYTEGITRITQEDMQYAESMDSVIKLIAVSRKEGGRIFARVSPAIISKSHPLAGVEDVFNAIVVSGDAIGEAMFYGKGAGKLPTASAVVADIIDIAKYNVVNGSEWKRNENGNMVPFGESMTRYFVRLSSKDKAEAAEHAGKLFGRLEFIRPARKELEGEIAFTTSRATEAELSRLVNVFAETGPAKEIINVIRIEE